VIAAWAALDAAARKQWVVSHPAHPRRKARGEPSAVPRKRRIKVPAAFKSKHDSDTDAVIRDRWLSMSKPEQKRFMFEERVRQIDASTPGQCRNVTLPIAFTASSISVVVDTRTSQDKYSSLHKWPRLAQKYTEEQWKSVGGAQQRSFIAVEKLRQQREKENVTVENLWQRDRDKTARKKRSRKLTQQITKLTRGLRLSGMVQKFARPAILNSALSIRTYNVRMDRRRLAINTNNVDSVHPSNAPLDPTIPVPSSALAASWQCVFPPATIREMSQTIAGRPRQSILVPSKPIVLSCHIDDDKKLAIMRHLIPSLNTVSLAQLGLARLPSVHQGSASPLVSPPFVEFNMSEMKSMLESTSKQRRRPVGAAQSTHRERGVFGDLASLSNRVAPSDGRSLWGSGRR
jgi:hypothetical protein